MKKATSTLSRETNEQIALPEKLVAEIAKQQAITVNIWKKAKAAKSFAQLKPDLEKLVTLNKHAAQILMKVKET